MSGDALLRAIDLKKTFGGLTAVDGASFDVERGSITGLIGPNGAGKSTTFNLLSGYYELDDGSVVFDGDDVTDYRMDQRAQRGMIRTFQITRELTGMTVMENMLLGAQNNPGEAVIPAFLGTGGVSDAEAASRERARDLLDQFDLWKLHDEYAGNLSGGQRKLLELARALMAEPSLLLLDEPMAGVNPELTDQLLAHIETLSEERDTTFVIVEHDMDVIMSTCDWVIGMHNGDVLTAGPPAEVQQDEDLLEAYLGGEV